jgi:hypothetical protein
LSCSVNEDKASEEEATSMYRYTGALVRCELAVRLNGSGNEGQAWEEDAGSAYRYTGTR